MVDLNVRIIILYSKGCYVESLACLDILKFCCNSSQSVCVRPWWLRVYVALLAALTPEGLGTPSMCLTLLPPRLLGAWWHTLPLDVPGCASRDASIQRLCRWWRFPIVGKRDSFLCFGNSVTDKMISYILQDAPEVPSVPCGHCKTGNPQRRGFLSI